MTNLPAVSWLIVVNAAGYATALLTLGAFFSTDTVRLRQIALASNVAYVLYGGGTHVWTTLALHATLLPINAFRLRQLLHERDLIERALSASEVSPAWLTPFMHRRRYAAGSVLFRRGDPADAMFFLADGRLIIDELGVELGPGVMLGEIGMFAPGGKRTQTVRALEDVLAYTLPRDGVLALYRRDPGFGIYLVRLITSRLVEDLAAAESRPAAPS